MQVKEEPIFKGELSCINKMTQTHIKNYKPLKSHIASLTVLTRFKLNYSQV